MYEKVIAEAITPFTLTFANNSSATKDDANVREGVKM